VITIIDYGCGNPASIRNMLKKLGHDSVITDKSNQIADADKLILPGVGAFDHGMQQLADLNIAEILKKKVEQENTPILGICLGVQLFCNQSEEGQEKGFGWIDADVVRFDKERLREINKIPHMGWCDLTLTGDCRLFEGVDNTPRFYFVHSYHLDCNQAEQVSATAIHGYEFVAAVEKDNVAGVQFHPEKSHRFGMALLNNFVINF
jgi:imidazole glycerol-phosphate synthase subunit HisH